MGSTSTPRGTSLPSRFRELTRVCLWQLIDTERPAKWLHFIDWETPLPAGARPHRGFPLSATVGTCLRITIIVSSFGGYSAKFRKVDQLWEIATVLDWCKFELEIERGIDSQNALKSPSCHRFFNILEIVKIWLTLLTQFRANFDKNQHLNNQYKLLTQPRHDRDFWLSSSSTKVSWNSAIRSTDQS